MTLVDSELQRVPARRLARNARQTAFPRFQLGRVGGSGTNARLKKYGIDVDGLQLVQYVAEVFLLSLNAHAVVGVALRPVQTAQRGEPNGSHLIFGLCGDGKCAE